MMTLTTLAVLASLVAVAPEPQIAADDTLVIDLSAAVSLALDDSYSSRLLDLNLARSEYDVGAARGRFRTRADVQISLPELEEGVQRVQVPGDLPRYDSYGSREISATLAVSQPLPTDGVVSLSGHVYQQDDSYFDTASDQTEDQRTFFNSYEVSLSQPLFAPNELKLGLESAEISHRLAKRAYQRGQLDLAYDVTSVFYSLVRAQEELAIARDAAQRQRENFLLGPAQVRGGPDSRGRGLADGGRSGRRRQRPAGERVGSGAGPEPLPTARGPAYVAGLAGRRRAGTQPVHRRSWTGPGSRPDLPHGGRRPAG